MSSSLKGLKERSGNHCELCAAPKNLLIYEVPESPPDFKETSILTCTTCYDQLTGNEELEPNHWRCLNDSMWSTVPAVKVVAYRVLHELKNEGWPNDLLDMIYMEEEELEWARAAIHEGPQIIHRDSNGNVLGNGDNIVLIKDLDVKGANFTAKRGTAVRRISLVHDNENHIEGKVNGQHIVILTQFIKKS
ncbi:MAG: PhnA domain-containing protein [Nonlabens sp.]